MAAAGDDIQLTPQNDDDGVLCTYTTEPSFSPESQGPNVERHLVSDCADSSKLKQCPDIVHGEPLTDRKSTFQAHAAAVTTKQEVWKFTDSFVFTCMRVLISVIDFWPVNVKALPRQFNV